MSLESSPQSPEQELSRDEALQEIQAILSEIMVTGAVDTEPDDLQTLQLQLAAGEIAPREAVVRARGIRDSRSNYH